MSKLIEYLLKRNLKIGFAESITGGALSYNFVKNEGASKYFKGSIICYSNSIKTDVLSVSKETIEKHGVVSNKVSEELAFGIKKILNLDVAISVTGNVEKNGIVFFSVLFPLTLLFIHCFWVPAFPSLLIVRSIFSLTSICRLDQKHFRTE